MLPSTEEAEHRQSEPISGWEEGIRKQEQTQVLSGKKYDLKQAIDKAYLKKFFCDFYSRGSLQKPFSNSFLLSIGNDLLISLLHIWHGVSLVYISGTILVSSVMKWVDNDKIRDKQDLWIG